MSMHCSFPCKLPLPGPNERHTSICLHAAAATAIAVLLLDSSLLVASIAMPSGNSRTWLGN